MKLTSHFTLKEMTASKTADLYGIKNEPRPEHIQALTLLCFKTLEPIRAMIGKPIRVTSGYRSPKLNRAVGGSRTSQHVHGQAADIQVNGMTVQELFDKIVASGIPFDQIIQEFDSWVHISFSKSRQRRSILYAYKDAKNKTVYTRKPSKNHPPQKMKLP